MLKESDDVVLWLLTFNSKLTFEKNLRLGSKAAYQRFGILGRPWRVFNDKILLERCFRGLVRPVLEYCSSVWCPAANTHLKQLDRVVSDAKFLTVGVFPGNIASRWSAAVYCMLNKIRCNLMHPLYGALNRKGTEKSNKDDSWNQKLQLPPANPSHQPWKKKTARTTN